jgi:hypothetical protein
MLISVNIATGVVLLLDIEHGVNIDFLSAGRFPATTSPNP